MISNQLKDQDFFKNLNFCVVSFLKPFRRILVVTFGDGVYGIRLNFTYCKLSGHINRDCR